MMANNQLISIIMPAYNSEAYIRECIDSVLVQSYRNVELIIVDDGSNDGTYDICKEYEKSDSRIKLFSQQNSGVVAARQAGLEKAQGKYVAFVDSDDWIDDDMIEVMLKNIEDCDLVSMGVLWEESKERVIRRRDLYPAGVYEGTKLESIFKTMVYDSENGMSQNFSPWMVNKLFLTKKALEIHRGVDKDIRLYEDASFVYRYLLECDKVKLIDEYHYHYRYIKESASHKKRNEILGEISRSYDFLIKSLESTSPKYGLKDQLRNWIMEKCYFSINEKMDIPQGSRVIRYLLKTNGFEGRRVAVYGAGRVGQDVHFQLEKLGFEVAFWADKRYEVCREEGLNVCSPQALTAGNYDVLLIAVENAKVIDSIRKDLMELGISEQKIMKADIRRLF